MFQDNKIAAFICARGGSKGLPGKNTISLGGKPLIQWTIEAGLNSEYVDEVIVSTESKEIADISIAGGAQVPYIRPAELAEDDTPIEDVINHAIDWLSTNQNRTFDILMLLMPTSPFRSHIHIDEAIQKYFENRTSSDETLVSVMSMPSKMGFLMQADEQNHIHFCFDNLFGRKGLRRQDLPKYYMPNGALYLAPTRHFENSFYSQKTQYYEMNVQDSLDIDSAEDLALARNQLAQNK